MTQDTPPLSPLTHDATDRLHDLGWSVHFEDQLSADEVDLLRLRIATVHRARMTAYGADGPADLQISSSVNTADYAVGDWVLADPATLMLVRRLQPHSLLQRRTDAARIPQLIAANVNTLFIVTSCNADLNQARMERYLALANEAGTRPVMVLTKIDQVEDPTPYADQLKDLQRGVEVVLVNGNTPEAAKALAPWCGPGQTVALVGSSGVGKSTLLNTLAEKGLDEAQLTGTIREDDARGRHTTTHRSLHPIPSGGWIIDTPGVRTLYVSDMSVGLDLLFSEIAELIPDCKFRNCSHEHEPGCAVRAGLKSGAISPERFERWQKLLEENRINTPVTTGPRGNKVVKSPNKRR